LNIVVYGDTYIYIYRERERKKERKKERTKERKKETESSDEDVTIYLA
jgi:hypothetical protein